MIPGSIIIAVVVLSLVLFCATRGNSSAPLTQHSAEDLEEIQRAIDESRGKAGRFPFDGTFRFFAPIDDPNELEITTEPKECPFCHELKPVYTWPMFFMDPLDMICAKCLGEGRLGDVGLKTNEIDARELSAQIRSIYPEISEPEVEAQTQALVRELTERTPRRTTFQDPDPWPIHCALPMEYLGETNPAELNALAPDGNGPDFFSENLQRCSDVEANKIWPAEEPNPPGFGAFHPYLFRCLACETYVIQGDFD